MNGALPVIAKYVSPNISRYIGRSGLKLRKNAPHILFVGGVAGVVTSTVLACRATLKLPETLDEIEKSVEYSRATDKDVAAEYVKSAAKLGRLYGPALGVGLVSLGALSGAHVNLTRRNTSLMAAYTALQASYEAYRSRVRDDLGADRERDIHLNVVDIPNEDGSVDKMINGVSPYARFFDEYSSHWVRDAEMNMIFLKCQQSYVNDLLKARGHVFLNEVYDRLGIDRTSAGAVVGWLYNSANGDNYIDFDIFKPENQRFVNGWENSVLLDFNVDGVIFENI